MICGRNNRYKLPQCLVNQFRIIFSNDVYTPYVGYTPSPTKTKHKEVQDIRLMLRVD